MTIAGPSKVKIRLVSTCIIDLSKMLVVANGSVTGDAILYLQSHRFLSRAAHTTFFLAFSPLLLKPISLISPFIRQSVPWSQTHALSFLQSTYLTVLMIISSAPPKEADWLILRLSDGFSKPRVGWDIPSFEERDSEPY